MTPEEATATLRVALVGYLRARTDYQTARDAWHRALYRAAHEAELSTYEISQLIKRLNVDGYTLKQHHVYNRVQTYKRKRGILDKLPHEPVHIGPNDRHRWPKGAGFGGMNTRPEQPPPTAT